MMPFSIADGRLEIADYGSSRHEEYEEHVEPS
jgi:hypothetical protein